LITRADFLSGAVVALVGPNPLPTIPSLLPQQQPQMFRQQNTIAVSMPLTGNLGQYGEQVVRGAQAAVDEANKLTPSLQRIFALRALDDQNSTSVAVGNVSIAQSDSTVIGMVGNLTYDVTVQALPQCANASLALVVPTVTKDDLTTKGYHNVFRLPTKDSSEGQLFAQGVLRRRKPATVIALNVDGEYGYAVARAFVAQAKANKYNADLLTVGANADPKNTAEVVMNRSAEYVFLSGVPDKLGPVAVAMRANGYTGDFGASDGFYTPATTDSYGKALQGAYVASALPPLDKVPAATPYLQDFLNEVGGSVTAFSAYGYAAAQLLIQAAQRVNSSIPNRSAVLTALQQGGTYNLLVGQYSFNFAGDAIVPNIYLYKVAANGFNYVRPAIATGYVLQA
jgi:branched-chain amino acid transport system substrate-binding protein